MDGRLRGHDMNYVFDDVADARLPDRSSTNDSPATGLILGFLRRFSRTPHLGNQQLPGRVWIAAQDLRRLSTDPPTVTAAQAAVSGKQADDARIIAAWMAACAAMT